MVRERPIAEEVGVVTVEAAGANGRHRDTGLTTMAGRAILMMLIVASAAASNARGDAGTELPATVITGDAPLLLEGSGETVFEDVGAVVEEPVLGLFAAESVPVDLPEAASPSLPEAALPHVVPTTQEYVTFDVLFLERDNAVINQPLVTEGRLSAGPGGVVLTTRSLVPATAPGVRLFVGRHGQETPGWELGYWGCYGFFGDTRADLPVGSSTAGGLAIPGSLGREVPGWDKARTIRTGWSSSLNVAELNLLRSDFSTLCEPCSRWPTRRCASETQTDLIGGLFWAGLAEEEALHVTAGALAPTTYRVATSSNLFGGQVGVRRRRTWDRFAIEGWLKAGLGGAWLAQSAAPIATPSTVYRPGREAEDTGMGFLSSMNLSLAYRVNDVWGLRLGYNLAWLSGVALAGNQLDFDDTATAGTGVRGAGGLFLHGANVGVEGRW